MPQTWTGLRAAHPCFNSLRSPVLGPVVHFENSKPEVACETVGRFTHVMLFDKLRLRDRWKMHLRQIGTSTCGVQLFGQWCPTARLHRPRVWNSGALCDADGALLKCRDVGSNVSSSVGKTGTLSNDWSETNLSITSCWLYTSSLDRC